jgi:zinc resistance-associated protein
MNKLVVSAVAAAAIAGSAFAMTAVAATDAADAPGAHEMGNAGFVLDAKLAGMKAALKLTTEQEKLWPPFETAVRDAHKTRIEVMRAFREERSKNERPTPIARMTEWSDLLAKASEQLKKVADAASPLYNSLDETQKEHFGPLMMMMRPAGQPHWGEEGGHAMPE